MRLIDADALMENKFKNDISYNAFVSLVKRQPSAQPKLDEWCKDCTEYDQERHCCPRFNRVIRTAIDDAQPEIVRCKDCKYYQTDKCYIHIERIWELTPEDYCSQGERDE